MIERREQNRKVKTKAFLIVMISFLVVKIVGEHYQSVDHYSHLAVLAFLGARIFLRDI